MSMQMICVGLTQTFFLEEVRKQQSRRTRKQNRLKNDPEKEMKSFRKGLYIDYVYFCR